jgi:hypothetical protein
VISANVSTAIGITKAMIIMAESLYISKDKLDRSEESSKFYFWKASGRGQIKPLKKEIPICIKVVSSVWLTKD